VGEKVPKRVGRGSCFEEVDKKVPQRVGRVQLEVDKIPQRTAGKEGGGSGLTPVWVGEQNGKSHSLR
jgi:hypothetical protein